MDRSILIPNTEEELLSPFKDIAEAVEKANLSEEEAKIHLEKLNELKNKQGSDAIYFLSDWLKELNLTLTVIVDDSEKFSKIKKEINDLFEDLKHLKYVSRQSNSQRKKSKNEEKEKKSFYKHLETIKCKTLEAIKWMYRRNSKLEYKILKKYAYQMAVAKFKNYTDNYELRGKIFDRILPLIAAVFLLLICRVYGIKFNYTNVIFYVASTAILTKLLEPLLEFILQLTALSLNNKYKEYLSILEIQAKIIEDNIQADKNTSQ